MERPFTSNDELLKTLNTCKESAPGPDGISYEVYKKTWEISGDIILKAWNHSIKIGQTSQSQQEAIINLLKKKGKDKSELINLRPISLSNCDIKICTKTIALRTNCVLEKLLSDTQTGYVPGRQVTDHKFLLEVLRAYQFPETYIKWVKVIYTNLEASVLVNGYTTEKFRVEQSVKQGDALSCALFVLAIEPLLQKIQCNKLIKPVKVATSNNEFIEIKKAGFADDITCITTSESSLQVIINEYVRFSKKSGIKLNVNKT